MNQKHLTADQLFRAAMYAGATFVRMARADSGLTDAEVDEAMRVEPDQFNVAAHVGWLAIFVSSPELAHELVKRIPGAECSAEDLSRLSMLLEGLGGPFAFRSTGGARAIRKVTADWLGLSTVSQLRSAVVDAISDAVGQGDLDWLLGELKVFHPRFGGLDRDLVRDVLSRTTLDESRGGKMPGGKARLGPQGAAATLSVAALAWDDSDFRKSKAAFADAVKSEAERREAAQKAAILDHAERTKCKL